jgi:hypothetical protein
LFDGLDELIRCDVELDVAWLAGSERTDLADRGRVSAGELQVGDFCVLPGRCQRVGDRGDCRAGASVDDLKSRSAE